MKYPLLLIAFLLANFTNLFSQYNVGIGTNTPKNSLHVVVDPLNPNPDPVRFEGLLLYTTETSLLVVDQTTGVVKYMPLNNIFSNLDSNYLDSIILKSVLKNSSIIYNDPTVRDSILSIMLHNSDTLISLVKDNFDVRKLVLDSAYSAISDSLLKDITWLTALADSIDSDVDSVVINGTQLTVYENGQANSVDLMKLLNNKKFSDKIYSEVKDSLLLDKHYKDIQYSSIADSLIRDGNWLATLKDSIDSDVDSAKMNGSILEIYKDNEIYTVDLSDLLGDNNFKDSIYSIVRDSLLLDKNYNNIQYSSIADSLIKDNNWLATLKDSIDSDVDSAKMNGTILEIYKDNEIYTVDLSDLLGDNNFKDSIYSIVRDSLLLDKNYNNIRYSSIADSLIRDNNWLATLKDSIDSDVDSAKMNGTILEIYKDNEIYTVDLSDLLGDNNFKDSIYSIVRDSLLLDKNYNNIRYSSIADSLIKDNNWLATLKDSIDSDVDSLNLIGNNLNLYEDGKVSSVELIELLKDQEFKDSIFNNIRDSILEDNNFNISRYGSISDSLIKDGNWLDIVQDSIETDLDSVRLLGTIIQVFENERTVSADLMELTTNSQFLNSLRDSIDTRIDSVSLLGDTALALFSKGKAPIITDIKPLKDSVEWIDRGPYIEARRAGEKGNTVIVTDKGSVGIGVTSIDPSAALQIYSSKQGFLIPSMSTSERLGIPTPAPGLQVYDTDENCLHMYNGSNWKSLCPKSYKKDDAFARRVLKGDTLEMTQTFTLTTEQLANIIASLNSYPWVGTSGARVEGIYDIIVDGINVTNGMRLSNVNQGTNFLKFSNVATWSQVLYPGTHTITFRIICTDSPGLVDLTAEDRRIIITLQ